MDHRVTRRRLLRQAGGAAAAIAVPTIVPSSVFGAEAPSEQVRIGFIGVRNRGMQNLEPLMKHCAALCDVDQSVLAKAKAVVDKKNGGDVPVYSDYRKLLERKDLDAVLISTPDHWHALMTTDACEAGKDVYCEKPLTLTIHEGRKMVKAARKYGRIVQTGSQQRSDDKFRFACELIRAGRLGKLNVIKVGLPGVNMDGPAVPDSNPPPELDYNFWLGPTPERPYNANRVHYYFRFFWNYSGGQMTNFGAHHLDIAQWALGMDESGPISAEGSGKYHATKLYEVPQSFVVTYRYANGATIHCGSEDGTRQGITFEGERGWIWVNRGKLEASAPELLAELPSDAERLYVSKDHYQNFLACVKSRKRPICDVEIGHRSATVCHLGNIAIRSGRPLKWDPEKEKVIGDDEQQQMTRYSYRAPWKL